MTVLVFYRDINSKVGDIVDVRHFVDSAKRLGIPTISIGKRKSKNFSSHTYRNVIELIYLLVKERRKYKTIHLFCGYIPSVLLVALIARSLGKKTIYSPLGQLLPQAVQKSRFKKKTYIKMLLSPALGRSAIIHTCSNFEKLNCEQYFSKNKIVIQNLSISEFEIVGFKSAHNKDFAFSYIGRIDIWQKGLDVLILALDKFYEEHPDAKPSIIAGRATLSQKQKLEELLRLAKNAKKITIEYDISTKRKMEILSKSKCFAHPSRVEGFARAMREAINCRVPLVTTLDSNVGDYVECFKIGTTARSFDQQELNKALEGAYSLSVEQKNWHSALEFFNQPPQALLNEYT